MDALSKMLLAQAVKTVTRILQGDKGKDPALDRLLAIVWDADPETIKIVEQNTPGLSFIPTKPYTSVSFLGKDGTPRTIVIF